MAALRAALEPRVDAAEELRADLDDRALAEEIEPWLVSHRAESERMLAGRWICSRCCCTDAPAMQRVFAVFRLEGMLSRIVPVATASYGPRRVLYPQLGLDARRRSRLRRRPGAVRGSMPGRRAGAAGGDDRDRRDSSTAG